MTKKDKAPKGYAICRKGEWRAIVVYPDKEQAKNAIKGKEKEFEVREVLDV